MTTHKREATLYICNYEGCDEHNYYIPADDTYNGVGIKFQEVEGKHYCPEHWIQTCDICGKKMHSNKMQYSSHCSHQCWYLEVRADDIEDNISRFLIERQSGNTKLLKHAWSGYFIVSGELVLARPKNLEEALEAWIKVLEND